MLDPTTGKSLNPNLEEYKLPGLADTPEIDVAWIGEPDFAANHLGAKGIGEPPIIPAPAAIANAVADALGVRIPDLPITPRRVLTALAGGCTRWNRLSTSTRPPRPAPCASCNRRPTGRRGARPIAGGTDLLTTLKAGLHAPYRLVNLKSIRGLDGVEAGAEGLRIGALVTLDSLERHPVIRERYRALADAAGLAASPQLRNMGTLGGNLAQETRCWYYRNPEIPCWLKGGQTCYARDGENSHHAIFTDRSYCVSVHPSDPATALLALGATVIVQTADGERRLPIGRVLHPAARRPPPPERAGSRRRDHSCGATARAGRFGQPLPQSHGPGGVVLRARECGGRAHLGGQWTRPRGRHGARRRRRGCAHPAARHRRRRAT